MGPTGPFVFGPYTATTGDTSACSSWATDTYTHYYIVDPQTNGSFLVTNVMNGSFTLTGSAAVPGYGVSAVSAGPTAFDATSSSNPSTDGWYSPTAATCPSATLPASPSGSGAFEAFDTYFLPAGTPFNPSATPTATGADGIHNTQFFTSVFGNATNPAYNNIVELNNQFNYVYTPTSGPKQYFSQWMVGGTVTSGTSANSGTQYVYGNITG